MASGIKFDVGQELLAWDIFRAIPRRLLNDVRLFHVFGEIQAGEIGGDHEAGPTGTEGRSAESGIFVTTDDQVYATGKNDKGQLGIGVNGDVTEHHLVSELCGKHVIQFSSGQKFVIALTEEGHVYSFGHANWGMSGIVTSEDSVNSPRLISSIAGVHIVSISCGAYFTLALSKGGKVYTWGNNDWYQTATEGSDILEPIEISFPTGVKICSISAGWEYSVALSESGNVYTWGFNAWGQLGQCHSVTKISTPTLVAHLNGVPIVQISTQANLTTLLTHKGLVYSTGLNKDYEFAISNDDVHWKSPVLLSGLPRVTRLYSYWGCRFTAFETDNGVYVQGLYPRNDSGVKRQPELISGKSNIMELLFNLPVSCSKQIKSTKKGPMNSNPDYSLFYDNSEQSDVEIHVDSRTLKAHGFILKSRCHHFIEVYSRFGVLQPNGVWKLTITGYRADTYFMFIKYLYSGTLDVVGGLELLVELRKLAIEYNNTQLVDEVMTTIKSGIVAESAASLLIEAKKHQMDEIEDAIMEFIAKNIKDVVLSSDFNTIDPEMARAITKNFFQHYYGENLLHRCGAFIN